MTVSVLKISLLAVGATATAGAGDFAARGFFSSSKEAMVSISSLLKKNPNKRAISPDEAEDWKKVWKLYKESGKDVWRLGNGEEVPDALKSGCRNKLGSEVVGESSEDYKRFLFYCSRDTLISDLLKDEKVILLSKDAIGDAEGMLRGGRQREKAI